MSFLLSISKFLGINPVGPKLMLSLILLGYTTTSTTTSIKHGSYLIFRCLTTGHSLDCRLGWLARAMPVYPVYDLLLSGYSGEFHLIILVIPL